MSVGVLRSFVRTHELRRRVEPIDHPGFELSIRIAFFRARHLGLKERVALELQRILFEHFGTAGMEE